jgi:hypothetical protein
MSETPGFPAGLLEAIKPRIGADVHYIMPTSGKHRPATVVEVFGDRLDGLCNLQVFTDGSNDGFSSHQGTLWATAIHRDDTMTREGTWHWPEGTREAQAIAHVIREQTVFEETMVRENTPPPPGADSGPPTTKHEAVTSTTDAGEEAVTTKAPAAGSRKKP